MTIQEAIETLDANIKAKPPGMNHDYFNALELGKEALKAYKHSRQFSSIHHVPLLPGETEE